MIKPDFKGSRPDFKFPPVTEVYISILFTSLEKLDSARIGLFWSQIKDDFPETRTQPALNTEKENFGPPEPTKISFNVSQVPPTPRSWFINSTGDEMIQLQSDRFIYNWLGKEGAEEYPRFEHVFDRFSKYYQLFTDFIINQEIGETLTEQCEISYINIIELKDICKNHGEMDKLFTNWTNVYSDDFLSSPENADFRVRFLMGDDNENPVGRLHVSAEPRHRVEEGYPPVVRLTLIARGLPLGEGFEGISKFIEYGRECIVRGFASITTPKAHELWERKDE